MMAWVLILMSFSDSFGAMLPFRHDVPFETLEQCEAANAPATPPTNAELHAAIRSKISGPQWALLEVLIRQRVALSRAELAEHAGVSAASSGFEKNVSTLSSFGFVTYPERGYVQVADIMFVER